MIGNLPSASHWIKTLRLQRSHLGSVYRKTLFIMATYSRILNQFAVVKISVNALPPFRK